ncbi:3-mercaptopyruvate sulfurtransferase [Methylocystis sp.]|uniref:3-mercaptopyruvate sulfurtransferase n=1 Tax=Methylocystis sp. TaxID=1911079 RepID=UPI0025EE4353|nr:3-mercaptopyruvate sulfurtransferase [Methylocystis sp.]
MARTVDPNSLFVSPDWLAVHLSDADLVVFDASWHMPATGRDAHAEFLTGHIPGAQFFDIDAVSDRSSGLPHMLPKAEAFAAEMRRLGFGDGMRAVVYDSVGIFSAPRLWWTLAVFGAENTSILAGGLPAWKAEGRPLEQGEARKRAPVDFTPRFDASVVADAEAVRRALDLGGAQVADARGAERFHGWAPEPRPGLRSGHMPGALNLPFGNLLERGRMKERAGLEAAFASAGLNPDAPVIATCGSGLTACIISLALAATGRPLAMVYDGSWSEWGATENLPAVVDDRGDA